jgi:hypothetical protein
MQSGSARPLDQLDSTLLTGLAQNHADPTTPLPVEDLLPVLGHDDRTMLALPPHVGAALPIGDGQELFNIPRICRFFSSSHPRNPDMPRSGSSGNPGGHPPDDRHLRPPRVCPPCPVQRPATAQPCDVRDRFPYRKLLWVVGLRADAHRPGGTPVHLRQAAFGLEDGAPPLLRRDPFEAGSPDNSGDSGAQRAFALDMPEWRA